MASSIEEAAARCDWPAARSLFADYQALPRPNWRKTALLAASVMDWLVVLRAEKAFIAESGLEDPADLPPRLAKLAIQARQRLELTEEAVSLARACRLRDPGNLEWLKREGESLIQLGDYEAALEIGRAAWSDGGDFGAGIVAKSLIELGAMADCDRFLSHAEQESGVDDRSAQLLKARARYWTACSDPAQALATALRLPGETSEAGRQTSIAKYAALAHDRGALNRSLAQAARWLGDPASEAISREAAPAILVAHYRGLVDWPAVRPWVDMLSKVVLSPRAAGSLGQMLLRAGEYSLAHRVTRMSLECFPSAPPIWRQHLRVLSLLGDPERLSSARRQMRRQFPPEIYLGAMSMAEVRSWDLHELPELFDCNIESDNRNRQNKFFASLAEIELSEEQAALLKSASAKARPLVAAELELKFLAMDDLRRLERAVLAPVNFAEFEQTPAAARERVAVIRKSAPAAHGMPECLDLLAGIQRDRSATRLFTREAYADSANLARMLIDRIGQRRPTSLIRLGDGEGHFLPATAAAMDQRQADRVAQCNTWWGKTRIDAGRLKAIERDFVNAVNSSSMLAIIPPWRVLRGMSKSKFTHVHRGIWNSIQYCASMADQSALVTSAHFPNDLHNWNLWGEIFSAARSVSYISCHHMAPWLRETFGLATREAIHIPGENRFDALFAKEAEPRPADTLLDRHEEVCSAIHPRPGEIFLVAAGFLGKIYCETVRGRGGIAIDIGSLADYWMGFNTRRYRLEQHSSISLANSLIEDHILASPTDRSRIVGLPDAVRSTRDCRYNIADSSDRQSLGASPREGRGLRVVGHPRCASGYVAGLFRGLGLEIGHEKLLGGGISSWMHAVADFHIPYGDNASVTVDFAHTVAHVRDPSDAIPSIMLENGRAVSFNFRRLHILRAYGVDLCDYGTALDRAVASLVYWYDLIMGLHPEAIFRVEDAEEPVRAFLARTNLLDDAQGAGRRPPAALPAPRGSPQPGQGGARDPDGPPDIARLTAINNAAAKFRRAKPAVTKEAYGALATNLRDRLEAYCARFDYGFPAAEIPRGAAKNASSAA